MQAIRVLGLLGALDPYKHKLNLTHSTFENGSSMLSILEPPGEGDVATGTAVASNDLGTTTSEMLVNMAPASLEEFYPAVAIATLMRIIRDPSLPQHHNQVVTAITFIFKSLGVKCVPYVGQVVPAYLLAIKNSEHSFREVDISVMHYIHNRLY